MYVKVGVVVGARRERVVKKSDDHFVISVKERAEGNLANERVLLIISDIYETKKVRIVKGHHGPSELFSVGD